MSAGRPESEPAPWTDTNDTKIETTAETVETVAEDPNALEALINTSYNH
jgi:hypothetical protein